MNPLQFMKPKAAEQPAQLSEDELRAFYKSRGIDMKDPHTTSILIREDGANAFRAMCMDCHGQQDIFGVMAPADANGECSVVQRCMEHAEKCSGRSRPIETFVIKSKHDPVYKLTITWSV